MAWQVRQYGSVFDDFYAACDPELREAVDQRLTFLRLRGNLAREPVSKPVTSGLFELRANTHRLQARFLYFFQKGQVIVVVTAFFKKTRTTPQSEIRQALKRKQEIEQGEVQTNESHYLH